MAFDLFETMKRFAYEHLKTPDDAMGAAQRAFVNDDISAAQVADHWPTNAFVIKFKQELLSEFGEEHFLPSKSDIARQLYKIGANCAQAADDRIKALKELANLLGYIEKPAAVTVNTGSTNNRVMIVRDHGTVDDWEQRAIEQQSRLINGHTVN